MKNFGAILTLSLLFYSFGAEAQLNNPNSNAGQILNQAPKSNWSYMASTRWSRPLIEPAVETASIGFTANYAGFKKLFVSTSLGAYRDLVSESPDPAAAQSLTDLRFSFLFKKSPFKSEFLKRNKISSAASFGVSLPTSEGSRRRTTILSASMNSNFSKKIWGGIYFSTGLSAFGAYHRYTNFVAARNSSPFSFFGVSMPFAISKSFFKNKTNVFLSYNISTRINYDYDWVGANSVALSLGQQLTKKLRVFGSYSWGDRIVTDNNIFTAEAVRASAGLIYRF